MEMRGTCPLIVPHERMVSTEAFDQAWYEGSATGTLVFTEQAGRTTITMTACHSSNEVCDAVLKTPMEKGVGAGCNALEALLTAGFAETGQ
jgi:uncharacterized protein YndB with AHSA1/START domain